MTAKIYTISIEKGGAGKTSLVTNLAAVLSEQKKKVLIIDTDPQGNCSLTFGISPRSYENTIEDVLIGNLEFKDVTHKLLKNLFLIPANKQMRYLEANSTRLGINPALVFRNKLKAIENEYDYILIDTPPSLGIITSMVLSSTHNVLIPCELDVYSLQGLIEVTELIEQLKVINPNIYISGIIATKVDTRTNLGSDYLQATRKWAFENNVRMFNTVIPRSVRFGSSVAYNSRPAVLIDKKIDMVKAYYNLTKEVF